MLPVTAAVRTGLGFGGLAVFLALLGVVGVANGYWPQINPGALAAHGLAAPAGFMVARRTGRAWAGALAGSIVAVTILAAAAAGLAFNLGESLIKFTQPVATTLLLGGGLAGTALAVALGAGFGLAGAAVARFLLGTMRRRIPLPRIGAVRRFSPPQLAYLGAIALALVVIPQVAGLYWNQVLGSIGIYLLMGLGLNIVVGYAGLLDLGYVAFFAIGAYTMAILTSPLHGIGLDFWLAFPIAAAIGALAGVLLGIPVLSLRGDYLAIVTLGFGEIIRIFSQNLTQLTNGPQGVQAVAQPVVAGRTLVDSKDFLYLIAVATLVVAISSLQLARSRIGRAWIALREDEDVARSLGIRAVRYKLLAFAVGALFAGIGGAIFAARQSAIFPGDFTLLVSINVLCLVIIGGMGSVPGVIIGVGDPGRRARGPARGIRISPGRVRRPAGGGDDTAPAGNAAAPFQAGPGPDCNQGRRGRFLLTVANGEFFSARAVTKRFGGVVALDRFSIDIASGTIVGLIGPNGAGKSTFFNVITGFEKADSGRIEFRGRQIGGLAPEAVAGSGIARTFQNIRLFDAMSVYENVQVGQHRLGNASIIGALVSSPRARAQERASELRTWQLLDLLGLAGAADERASALPYGLQRRVEIARALAADPKLLLLDEPSAGMSGVESAQLASLIERLRSQLDLTVLLIEHNMNVVMSISDQVAVLNFGSGIAAGPPAMVRAHPAVIEAYLGTGF